MKKIIFFIKLIIGMLIIFLGGNDNMAFIAGGAFLGVTIKNKGYVYAGIISLLTIIGCIGGFLIFIDKGSTLSSEIIILTGLENLVFGLIGGSLGTIVRIISNNTYRKSSPMRFKIILKELNAPVIVLFLSLVLLIGEYLGSVKYKLNLVVKASEISIKGYKALEEGNYDKAIFYYTQCIALDKDEAIWYKLLGDAYLGEKQKKEALRFYKIALKKFQKQNMNNAAFLLEKKINSLEGRNHQKTK